MAKFDASLTREEVPQARPGTLKRFLREYVWPYRFFMFVALLLGVGRANIPLLVGWSMKMGVDEFMPNHGVAPSLGGMPMATFYGLVVLGLLTLFPVVYFRTWFMGRSAQRIMFDLRHDLFEHIQKMSLSFFEKRQVGGIISRVITDINIAQNFVGNALTTIAMDTSRFFFVIVFVFMMDWKVALIAMTVMPVYIVIIHRLRKEIRRTSRMVQDKLEDLSGQIAENFAGVKVVQSFHMEKTEEREFFGEARQYLGFTLKGVRLHAMALSLSICLTTTAPALMVWYMWNRVLEGSLTVGTVVVIGAWLGMLYEPLMRFTELNVIYANAMAALDRVFEIFDMRPEVQETWKSRDLPPIRGDVHFDHVTFAYTPGMPVIHDVDFVVQHGERVALVGESGSGKTTILNLLLRFYDPQQGRVVIDGHDIKKATLRSIRNQIGVVLQESVLFSDSISDNIRYGRRNATEKEVVEAAKMANAHEFIMELEEGYGTLIGERGVKLSGGQRQRVQMARVFLKAPKIIILDEATSSLDSASEATIQEALDKLMQSRTTFIIAHRLSTVMNVDKIVVLRAGRVMEAGSHHQLLEKGNGTYRRLYEEQFKAVLAPEEFF